MKLLRTCIATTFAISMAAGPLLMLGSCEREAETPRPLEHVTETPAEPLTTAQPIEPPRDIPVEEVPSVVE